VAAALALGWVGAAAVVVVVVVVVVVAWPRVCMAAFCTLMAMG
jgi:hypothetical protein